MRRLKEVVYGPRLGGLALTITDELRAFLRTCTGTCSARVRGFAYMYLGCSLAGEFRDVDDDDVRAAFERALELYPAVELDEEIVTDRTRAIWQRARAAAVKETVP